MSEAIGISSEEAQAVAQTIIQQLGGRRFSVLTGAKQFVSLREQCGGLQFKLPADPGYVRDGINIVRIILTAADLYDVQYGKASGLSISVLKESKDLYWDQLQSDFTEATGLYTRF